MLRKEAPLKRGRLLVSVGCVIQLPLRVVCTVSTPQVTGAKESIHRLQQQIFASDIHLVWISSMQQGVSLGRLLDWLRHAGWVFERTGDLDLVGVDRVIILDTWNQMKDYCVSHQITHAVYDSNEWADFVESVPCRYLLSSSEQSQGIETWQELERRLLDE